MTVPSRRHRLLQLLEAFEPDPSERRARNEMLLLLNDPGDPFSRYSYAPGHFTAAGCVLGPDAGSLLLVHHRRLDRWVQPGGHIDADDVSAADAARREVVEETGVVLADTAAELFDVDVHPIPSGRGEPPHHHFDLRFRFRAVDTHLEPALEEVNAAAWVPFAEVRELSSERSLRRLADKLASDTASGSGATG